ncbi:MAG: isoprenylcysteine carboxylmethyltransferase family protein [Xanthobacteraceae bacterium]
MIARLLLQNIIWIVGMGAVLFLSAGTSQWPAGWIFLVTMALLGLTDGLWLAKSDPDLLAERMNSMMQPGQPTADKIFIVAFGCIALIWFVIIGLERRAQASDMPMILQTLGFVLLLLSNVFVMWVMRTNSFAAPVVKIQAERGQHVIDNGPYAYVRHPMYSGTILFFAGLPLLLGSWWGLIMMPLFVLLFGYRATLEKRALISGLPGYTDYMTRVRYRLILGIW